MTGRANATAHVSRSRQQQQQHWPGTQYNRFGWPAVLPPSRSIFFVLTLLLGSVQLYSQRDDPLQSLIRQQRWTEALPLAETAVQRQPEDGVARHTLALVLHSLRRHSEAHRQLRKAERILPANAGIHRLLGLNYYVMERYVLFNEQMNKAKMLQPSSGEFDYWLGRFHQTVTGDCGKAIPLFDRALELDPANHRALYNRGDCRERLSDLALAEKD